MTTTPRPRVRHHTEPTLCAWIQGAALPHIPPMSVPAQNPPNTAPHLLQLRKALREGIIYMVTKGATQRAAALHCGMNERAFSKALRKPHVEAFKQQQEALFLNEIAGLKKLSSALAYQTGMDLMHNAKSESVKARMVELFRDEGPRGPQVAVNIQQNIGTQGYEYVPPGAQIVDITPAPDKPKDDDSDQ